MNALLRYLKIPKLNSPFSRTVRVAFAFFVLVLIPVTFQDCRTIDDSELNIGCTADCTTIRGRFTTKDGNTPIKNMRLEFDWKYAIMSGGSWRRKIATAETDENGNYSITFFAKDEELQKGAFLLQYHVPEKTYLSRTDHDHFGILLDKRDTIATGNFHIPSMEGSIHFKLTNPEAINGEDKLWTRQYLKFGQEGKTMYGFNGLNFGARYGANGTVYADKVADTTLHAAVDQYTFIQVMREKNGQHSATYDSLMIAPGQVVTYPVKF